MIVLKIRRWVPIVASVILVVSSPLHARQNPHKTLLGKEKIGHIVVIYLENHSFDSLYGLFPGADGLKRAKPENTVQVDESGQRYSTLPRVMDSHTKPPSEDRRFPQVLPNRPFDIGRFVPPDQQTGDLTHRFYQHQMQINGGKMDRFAGVSEAGGLTMGHYEGRLLPLWRYAQRYTLADHFFQAAFGGSFLNHQWLICACSPRYENAPDELKASLNATGGLVRDGAVTPDGYAVNTLMPAQAPHPNPENGPSKALPSQTQATIGDRLSEKNIGWAWYAGGWNDAVTGKAPATFQYHHQPFVYYQAYAENTEARRLHLKDEKDFIEGIEKGQLPQVAFYKPVGQLTEHPGYADVLSGDQHVADLLKKIEASPVWKDSVVIVTYDEYGGFWDHVPPPAGDRWGPGSRIPAIIVSPFSKGGRIDSTSYDTTSILKFIETRFDLEPLGSRDASAHDLINALKL